MIHLNTWFNNIIKLDLIYKINVVNSYAFPSIYNMTINICSKFAVCNPVNTLCSITVILLITNQKPILYSLKSKRYFLTNIKTTLRKKLAFNLLAFLVFFIAPNFKTSSLSGLLKTSSFSIVLDDLSIFPQLNNQYINLYNSVITFYVNFDLLKFNVFSLVISSFITICD
jgi:ribosomal protein L5